MILTGITFAQSLFVLNRSLVDPRYCRACQRTLTLNSGLEWPDFCSLLSYLSMNDLIRQHYWRGSKRGVSAASTPAFHCWSVGKNMHDTCHTQNNVQAQVGSLHPDEGNIDKKTQGITYRIQRRKKRNDSPSLIWAHLKSFSVCRMLRGICVNELHHSCEMMAQLGKQKCKVWQFKWMCFVSVCKQHLRDSICIKAGL